jgi:glycosyltransferase involved in cell wall biosynthesis
LPHVEAGDLAAIYAAAEAFVSPSAYEGFGFAVADALAAGVPTVISDVSSLPELCGEAAVRLRELSADAVAEALAAVLGDPMRSEVRRQLGRHGGQAHHRLVCNPSTGMIGTVPAMPRQSDALPSIVFMEPCTEWFGPGPASYGAS